MSGVVSRMSPMELKRTHEDAQHAGNVSLALPAFASRV